MHLARRGFYRHFKGALYFVDRVARFVGTGAREQRIVFYTSIDIEESKRGDSADGCARFEDEFMDWVVPVHDDPDSPRPSRCPSSAAPRRGGGRGPNRPQSDSVNSHLTRYWTVIHSTARRLSMRTLARAVTFTLHPHDNADALSIAKIDGTEWQAVVRTAEWPGAGPHHGVYVEIDALLDVSRPEFAFLAKTASKTLADGRPAHRVKTMRLRGKLSQGLLIQIPLDALPMHVEGSVSGNPADVVWAAGHDLDWVAALGIERYEPPVPADLRGEQVRCPGAFEHYGSIENAKNQPNLFVDGETVRISEKLHGTSWRAGLVDDGRDAPVYMVGSHATARDPQGATNLYALVARRDAPEAALRAVAGGYRFTQSFIVYGEVFGHKVQDLRYGCAEGVRKLRLFDVKIDGVFQPWETVEAVAQALGLETVPLLYRGPFDRAKVLALRDGPTTLPGAAHVREGVVVVAEPERTAAVYDDTGATLYAGRAALKYISDAYLERRDAKDGH